MFYKLLHQKKYHLSIPDDRTKWPYSWVQILLKQYPRFKSIALKKDLGLSQTLAHVLKKRKSVRICEKGMSIDILAHILFYSAGLKGTPGSHTDDSQSELDRTKRHYPSAGGRYPLEVYVLANKINGLRPNIYHYNVLNHSLEETLRLNVLSEALSCFTQKWTTQASSIIIISSLQYRSSWKYGDQGYLMSLIESGHLAQNFLLTATAFELNTCPIFGFNKTKLQTVLRFDTEELVLYAVAIL